jgi:kinetochore protein Mis12/MTW1
MEPDVNRTGA